MKTTSYDVLVVKSNCSPVTFQTKSFSAIGSKLKSMLAKSTFDGESIRGNDRVFAKAIHDNPVQVIERVATNFGLNDDERGGVLRHLIEGGDLSQWGLLNAVTRQSQDVSSYDRATELERMGGKILELPRNEWERLAA